MSFSSVTPTNTKTAEFAHLFDIFERVATRRTRALTGDASELISADDIAAVPAEFAPMLKNLSAVLSLRTLRDDEHARRAQAPSTPVRTSRHVSLAGVPSPFAAENPTFPLGEGYPFTFKLMLHKLYELDEWAEKVKSALETSKSQFKPLAERDQNAAREGTTNVKERGEKRSGIRAALGVSPKSKPTTMTRRSYSLAIPAVPPKPETSRALKKRCIGRRKSISGPMSTSVWVYDAAVSAVEKTGPRAVEMSFSKPRNAGCMAENRARHESMTALEGKRRVKTLIPHFQSGFIPQQPQPFQFALPTQGISETENMEKMKRIAEPCKRVAVKRPLCV